MITAASGRSHERFATTRWSMVIHPGKPGSSDSSRALDELVRGYWYPVYAYIRHCGHEPGAADGITRTFLTHLLRRCRDGSDQPRQGDFRRFLLDELNRFLGGDWRVTVGGEVDSDLKAPPGLEERNRRDNANATSPEQAYLHSFALEVVARALNRLHDEARQNGHDDMYQALLPYLGRDPVAGESERIAARLKVAPLALVIALKRLRQRFRELSSLELADTVNSPENLADEQAALHAALRGTPRA
jgi:RNA polymerase sigma-70 factor (ECF subfamily)